MNDRPNPGWFGRNWKWFVPTGCLSVLLLAALIMVAVVGMSMKGLSSLMSSSVPVRHAMELAQADPAVVAALGKPLETGMTFSGSLHTENANGSADLRIPVTGPKGSGQLYVKGDRQADRWSYSLIEMAIDASGQRIDLLHDGDAAPVEPRTDTIDADPAAPAAQTDPVAPAKAD